MSTQHPTCAANSSALSATRSTANPTSLMQGATMARAKYKVTCPHYKPVYFSSFMGAHNYMVATLIADDEVPEATWDYGYNDGLALWERSGDGGWQYDSTNTDEAWNEATNEPYDC